MRFKGRIAIWVVAFACCASAASALETVGPLEETPSFVTPLPAWTPGAPTPFFPAIRSHASGDEDRWFYSGLPYGSEALVHPLRLIVNGGFGALQFDNRSNRLEDVGFHHGVSRLWGDLRSPLTTIQKTGWREFLEDEVAPVSFSRSSAQYWPNYTLHLIGGGMSTVMMREWFEQHGVAHASLAAGATLATYHVLNEIVEASSRTELSTDAVADLMIFDPAGAWLFSHDGVDGFFSRRLHLRDWSSQPAIDPTTGALENHGQNFSMKLALPRLDHWSLFYYFGNHGEAGLSYRRANGSAFSVGGGLRAGDLLDLGDGVQTVDLLPSAGFFYDRNGSLLFSVTTARSSRDFVRVNAYPGLVHLFGWSPGLFLAGSRHGGTVMGLHVTQLPLGVAGRP